MTEQRRDDRVLDAAVETAWRQTAREQPPAAVDAAILAAARAAVRSGASERNPARPSRWWANWQPLAAAAGVIGLSFLLVQMLPREQLPRPPAKQGAPQPAAESAPVTVAPAPSAGTAHPAPAGKAASSPAVPRPAPVLPSVQPPPAPVAAATNDAASVMPEAREATAGAAPRAAMEAAAAKQSVAAEPGSAAAWASRIAALHDAGELAAAEAELRAFRASNADADLYLPEPLRAWAASVTQDGTP